MRIREEIKWKPWRSASSQIQAIVNPRVLSIQTRPLWGPLYEMINDGIRPLIRAEIEEFERRLK